jgi:hypothetical protein
VDDTLNVDDVTILMQGASITQTADLKPIFSTSTKIRVSGGRLVGKATDYVDTNATYVSCAIRALAGATRVSLTDCDIIGFAGAAVYATGARGIVVRDCDIVGVGNGGGGGTFGFVAGVSKDNAGVIFDGNSSRIWVIDNDISYVAQGVLGGTGSADVHVNRNTIHDVGGQHGIYLNYTDGAEIAGNIIHDVSGAGIKVQTQTGGSDSISVAVTGNTVDTCGANGIIFTCDTGALRHKDASVVGNTVRSASNDGIVLEYVDNIECVGNTIRGARAGIRVTDFTGASVKVNRIKNCAQDGILVQALDFSSTDCTIESNEIRDPASANNAATEFGIRVAEAGAGIVCTDVKLKRNDVVDTLGNMRYGIYCSVADISTFVVINNESSGATDYGFRGAATAIKKFAENTFDGALGRVYGNPLAGSIGTVVRDTWGTAPPTSGSWKRGDRCWSTSPLSTTPLLWVCTTDGAPGTWVAGPTVP